MKTKDWKTVIWGAWVMIVLGAFTSYTAVYAPQAGVQPERSAIILVFGNILLFLGVVGLAIGFFGKIRSEKD